MKLFSFRFPLPAAPPPPFQMVMGTFMEKNGFMITLNIFTDVNIYIVVRLNSVSI
jgi:hypothetical protein